MDETKPGEEKKEFEIPLQPHFERERTEKPIQSNESKETGKKETRKEKNPKLWYAIALGLGALALMRKKRKKANPETKNANQGTKNANSFP
ncbi:MAG: hypothetical protein JW724_02235 [Candidatus Altiarchaeota archaeon]|nr:hypothetical protein [Candidatus Altiarchaeota archaeon]